MTCKTVAAVDLGAESGRVTAVSFDGYRLDLQIVNRFANTPVTVDGVLRWNLDGLWESIRAGLGELAAGDVPVASVGVDTWGVDYGLYGHDGTLLRWPTCYRDLRTEVPFQRALTQLGVPGLYQASGIQVMGINTVFQLMADAEESPGLSAAASMLMMPDTLHHLMSGSVVTEFTHASTSGAYDMKNRRWATELLETLGVPTHMLPEVVSPGTDVGALIADVAADSLRRCRVIVPAGHDTACAVAATPYRDAGAVFISSGTWSLIGTEVPEAIITEASQRANVTNEGAYGGGVRLLRNVMGLWILQECRRAWARRGEQYSYPELAELAAAEPGFESIIDAEDQTFLAPGDMPDRVRAYCARAGFVVPESVGAIARCVLDSLALGYRGVIADIAELTTVMPPSISIVGGGSNNALLNQLTADATGLPVYSGPAECTALGNAAIQLTALGEIDGAEQIRQVIAAGTQIAEYYPRVDDRWARAQAQLAAAKCT